MLLEKCFTYRLLGMGATAELGVFVVVLENSPSQDFRQEIWQLNLCLFIYLGTSLYQHFSFSLLAAFQIWSLSCCFFSLSTSHMGKLPAACSLGLVWFSSWWMGCGSGDEELVTSVWILQLLLKAIPTPAWRTIKANPGFQLARNKKCLKASRQMLLDGTCQAKWNDDPYLTISTSSQDFRVRYWNTY